MSNLLGSQRFTRVVTLVAQTTGLSGVDAQTPDGQPLVIPNNTTALCRISAVGRRTDAVGDNMCTQIHCALKRDVGPTTAALVGSPAADISVFAGTDAASYSVVATADTTNGGLTVTCAGFGTNITEWRITVELTEFTEP